LWLISGPEVRQHRIRLVGWLGWLAASAERGGMVFGLMLAVIRATQMSFVTVREEGF